MPAFAVVNHPHATITEIRSQSALVAAFRCAKDKKIEAKQSERFGMGKSQL
jgi:hypothetical protein